MHKKTMTLLIVLIFSLSCLAVVCADNNTTDSTVGEEIEDIANYIMPISIINNEIKFGDGFTGFCIDVSKNAPTTDDGFTSASCENSESENYVKLAIIECYKAGRENEIGKFVEKVLNRQNDDEITQNVLSSTESIGNGATVKIDNTTEATFEFELLKSANDEVSDCLGYKVSLKTVANDDVLSSSDDEKVNLSEIENETVIDETGNTTNEKTGEASGGEIVDENGDKANKSDTTNDEKTNKTEDKQSDGETVINETNKTIVNKTNTVIINETNTTIINKNNTKVINKTNETPQNATVQDSIMKTVGNPIFLLVVVIAIIAIVAVVMRRKN